MFFMRSCSVWGLLAPTSLWLNLAAAAGSLPGADPSVILHSDKNYYAVESLGDGISIRKATDLGALSDAEPQEVWNKGDRLGSVWAPEIVGDGGHVYIYFAGDSPGGNDLLQRTYVIGSDQPGSGYDATETALGLPDDQWAIDGTLFRYEDQLWFAWSGWEAEGANEQILYICRMDSPTEPAGERHVISQPCEPWERVEGNPFINEGPEAIVDPAGQLHVVYSADGSWTESYCLADLRLKEGGDPANVWDWYKSNGCLMSSEEDQMMDGWETTKEVNGPGHHTFVLPAGDIAGKGEPETDYPFMYHAVPKGTKYGWENRERFAGSFRWVEGISYSRENVPGDNENVGWSLRFSEKGGEAGSERPGYRPKRH